MPLPLFNAGVYDISIGGGSMAATLRPQEGRSAARTLQQRPNPQASQSPHRAGPLLDVVTGGGTERLLGVQVLVHEDWRKIDTQEKSAPAGLAA
jgi:hypothetical protein